MRHLLAKLPKVDKVLQEDSIQKWQHKLDTS